MAEKTIGGRTGSGEREIQTGGLQRKTSYQKLGDGKEGGREDGVARWINGVDKPHEEDPGRTKSELVAESELDAGKNHPEEPGARTEPDA